MDTDTGASGYYLEDGTSGGRILLDALTPGQLNSTLPLDSHLAIVEPVNEWLDVVQQANVEISWSFVPAVDSINHWFGDSPTLDSATMIASILAVTGPISIISTKPYVLSVSASLPVISPTGDGIKDTVTLHGEVTGATSWSLEILNEGGGEVRSFTGIDRTFDVVWDGKNTAGSFVPDGAYTYRLEALNSDTNEVSSPREGIIRVDTSAPQAALSRPENGSNVARVAAIVGTATDSNFESYEVKILPVNDSNMVKMRFSSTIPVTDGMLAMWNTENGSYTVGSTYRVILQATDLGGLTSSASVEATVVELPPDGAPPTVAIASPSEGALIGGEVLVTIEASDAETGIDYVQLYRDGLTSALSDQLVRPPYTFNWNTATVLDGAHTLYAKAYDKSGNSAVSGTVSVTTQNFPHLTDTHVNPTTFSPDGDSVDDPAKNDTTSVIGAFDRNNVGYRVVIEDANAMVVAAGEGVYNSYPDTQEFMKWYGIDRTTGAVAPIGTYYVSIYHSLTGKRLAYGAEVKIVEAPPDPPPPPPQIVSMDPHPNPFSPNGDGFEDTTTITATWDKVAPWSITILNGLNNATLLYQTGESIVGEVEWSGIDPATGQAYPDGGHYVLEVRLNDETQQVVARGTLGIDAIQVGEYPTAVIEEPFDGDILDAPIQIIGTADDAENFLYYTLSYRPKGGANWVEFARGTSPVHSGLLGVLDTKVIRNDAYLIKLTAVDAGEGESSDTIGIIVDSDEKVGHFSISQVEAEVPLYGFPLTISRTYDSRDKERGDFGYGWRMDISNVDLKEDVYDNIIVTLPDGRRKTFVNEKEYVPTWTTITEVNWGYFAGVGVYDSLDYIGPHDLILLGDEIVSWDDLTHPFRPTDWVLTQPNGIKWYMNENEGCYAIEDRLGNTLSFSAGGVLHSSGMDLNTIRDGQGRITKIIDPAGYERKYEYDAHGDLVKAIDPENNEVKYTYDSNHNLIGITDPRGITPLVNEYYPSGHAYAGRLWKAIDADGNAIEYVYDDAGRTQYVTDRMNHTTVYRYNSRGLVTSITDPLNHTTSYTYDGNGNKVSETDALNNTTYYGHDDKGNLVRVQNALGVVTSHSYNDYGQLLTTTISGPGIPQPRTTTTNTYDIHGNLVVTKDALGNPTYYAYDYKGNLLSTTDALGNMTRYAYDGYGRLVTVTDATNDAVSHTYDIMGNQLTNSRTRVVNGQPVAVTFTREFDKLGRLIKTRDAEGNEEVTVYNSIGKITRSIDKLGRETNYAYDNRGNVTRVDYPTGVHDETAYDANGRQVETRNFAGNITETVYDAAGRVIATRGLDPNTSAVLYSTSATYDSLNRAVSNTDAMGNTSTREYDDLSRVTSESDALGNGTSYAYDSFGNQIQMTDANGRTTRFRYDANNELVRTDFHDGTYTFTDYDDVGRKESETDQGEQGGKTTYFGYDSLGRLGTVTDALLHTTRYEYDVAGNETALTDANGHAIQYKYDSRDRLIETRLPLGQTETYAYNTLGQMVSRADFNGNIIAFAYDTYGRITSKTYPDTTGVTYTYTPLGQLATMTNVNGTIEYGYDEYNRLARVTRYDASNNFMNEITYTYDWNGNKTSVAVDNGSTVETTSYTYDGMNRLESVTDPEARTTYYTYDNVGNRETVTYPNNTVASYAYDTLNRLTYLENRDLTTSSIISSYAYELGAAGNRVAVTESTGRRVEYGYDNLYRLTQEKILNDGVNVTDNIRYTYDWVGNRLTKTDNTGAVAYSYENIPGT